MEPPFFVAKIKDHLAKTLAYLFIRNCF